MKVRIGEGYGKEVFMKSEGRALRKSITFDKISTMWVVKKGIWYETDFI